MTHIHDKRRPYDVPRDPSVDARIIAVLLLVILLLGVALIGEWVAK